MVVQTLFLATVPQALGDRLQLQQVIMNLIMNGADAMSTVADRPRILRIGSQIKGAGSVLVSVKDSGTGRPSGIAFSSLCSQPSPPARAWDCQFAEASSRLMVESFGPSPQCPMARNSGSQIPTAASGYE